MDNYIFSKDAFDQYISWQKEDKKTLRKINDLLEDIRRNGPLNGIGKPERLKYREAYSRHIDGTNRLVYNIDPFGDILIISCKGHYED